MKSKLLASAVLTLLTVAGICRAADPPIPEMPKPVKDHEWLKNLVGEWDCECEIFMEPGKPPVKAKSSESARMLGGFWVLTDGKGEIMGMPMMSQMTLGYDPDKKKFVGTWVDNMSSYLWHYTGSLDADGKKLTLDAEGPCPMAPGKMSKFKETIELKGKDQKSFTSQILGDDGKWTVMVKSNSRRKANGQSAQAAPAAPGVNRPVHFEIPANEPEKLAKFYTDVFGWQFVKAPIPGMEYWLCTTGTEGAGINGAIMPRQKPEHGMTNYINVTNIDATIEKATKAGAKVALAKMPIPGVGAVACLIDPQGNMCGLWEQEKK
jgi:predicted enzyme related to lactoylglutathione lyase